MSKKTSSTSSDLGLPITTVFGDEDRGITPRSVAGEQQVSGDMPDPESDDDTLLNSHQVGLRLDEDYDNPRELNIAADVAAAEAARRSPEDQDIEDEDEN